MARHSSRAPVGGTRTDPEAGGAQLDISGLGAEARLISPPLALGSAGTGFGPRLEWTDKLYSVSGTYLQTAQCVEVCERAGYMGQAEAAAWRQRIAVWQRFRRSGQQQMTPVIDPLLDDPDPFLP